jgi:Flp pilus assembly protein TadD
VIKTSHRAMATVVACVLAATALGAGGALASGGGSGGGGGGGGSMSGGMGPMYNANEEYQKGLAALRAQNYKAAVTAFDHVISVAPKDSNTWVLMGMSRAGAGDAKGARGAFERAVKFNSDSVIAHGELGQANARLGDTTKAQAELDWLKKKSDACAGTCKEAGDLKAEIGKLEAAMAPGGAAPAPGTGAPHASLLFDNVVGGKAAYVDAVALINEGRYEDALTSLQRSERAIGPHPDILTYMGFASRKLHRYDQAEGYYTAALKVDPNHVGATEYYGELKVERGDLKSARKLLAHLDDICAFGCTEAEELRGWIDRAPKQGS